MPGKIDPLLLALHLGELADRYGSETPVSVLRAYQYEVVACGWGWPSVVASMERALCGDQDAILEAVDALMWQARGVLCSRDAEFSETGQDVPIAE